MQEAAEFDKILEAYTRGGVSRESVYGGTSTMRSGSMHYASVGQQRVVKSIRGGGGKRYGDIPSHLSKL